MIVPELRPHYNAVTDALTATGVLVGDAQPPDGFGWAGVPGQSAFVPHMVVYPIGGGRFDGTLGEPWEDGSLVVQVTCVGETREQCQWVADRAIAALVAQPVTVPGRATVLVTLEDMAGVVRDDTVQPPVFMAPPRFRIWTTPS